MDSNRENSLEGASPSVQDHSGAYTTYRIRTRFITLIKLSALLIVGGLAVIFLAGSGSSNAALSDNKPSAVDPNINANAQQMLEEGKRIFRFETFGDEAFWGKTIKLHDAIQGSKLGGVGGGVSPKTALSVGLKVDAEAIPADVVAQIKAGKVNLDDPATTLALLKMNAVLGVKGIFKQNGSLESVGISCALCHSTVDDSFAPGIGRRLDGQPNRDLNVGAIISLAPDLKAFQDHLGVDEATLKKVLASWGPGKFDAVLFMDGKAMRPDGKTAAVLIPPAYGLAGVNLATYTGWGNVTYWNAFVSNQLMHGIGSFFDPRLTDAKKFPIAAKARLAKLGKTSAPAQAPDVVTANLAALQFYQLATPAPKPPAGSFDPQAAKRGEALFNGKAQCASCHVPPLFTEPGWNLHKASEIGIDDFQAMRSPDEAYRTTPLRGAWQRQKGGYYHDGRFATLLDVVRHYDQVKRLNLSDKEKNDLAEYVKSL